MRVAKVLGMLLVGAAIFYIYLTFHAGDTFIVWNIRFPRLLLAIIAGFVLAEVGAVFQAMLNNPLADPYILGTSSGAALGGSIAAVLGAWYLIPVLGFAGALGAMLTVWMLAHLGGAFDSAKLLLSGIIVSLLAGAMISLLMYLHHEDVGAIIGLLMGNLGNVFSQTEWWFFLIGVGVVTVVSVVLVLHGQDLNILTSGELQARSLGVDAYVLRRRMFLLCSLLTGFVVAYAGVIGFIGLIVPHMARRMFGVRRRSLLLLCGILGALLLTVCDFIAQHIAAIEIPVGVVTTLIGTPFFLYLMTRRT